MTVCGAVGRFLDNPAVCDRPVGHLGAHADHAYGDGDRVWHWYPRDVLDWPEGPLRRRAGELAARRLAPIDWRP